MAIYTMTMRELVSNPATPLFNFNYPFYMDDKNAKKAFEEKFIMYYYNCEIGFETYTRFQKALQARLVIKMPYYKQLYETELKSKDINFLLNKDLKEEFTRELVGNRKDSGTSENTASSTNTTSAQSNGKLSNLSDGVSSASLDEGYLTAVNQDSQSSSGQADANGTSTSSVQSDNTERETTSLLSQGNIGITSSAELLQKWREVLINMDEIIIEDCRDLFMKIY